MSFSLAHLSDPHLPPPSRQTSLLGLSPKQMLALLSWHRKRRRIHTLKPSAALFADIAAAAPDHIAVTGDLTNFSLSEEFVAARQWLCRFGPSTRLSVIPGNHDLTAAGPWADGLGQWQLWMHGDTEDGDETFPFIRRRGPVALIGLSTGVTTPVFSAAGALGPAQLSRLPAMLAQTRSEDLFRIVMIHHPPVMGPGGTRKALRDRAALCDVLRREGAELVLHGHHHVTQRGGVAGPDGEIPVFGVPAALAGVARPEIAAWHLHRILRTSGGWHLTTTARRYDPQADRFAAAAEWTTTLPFAQ